MSLILLVTGGPLVYVALERGASAVAHVKRMGTAKRRQPTESSQCSQMPFAVTSVAAGRRRMPERRRRGESSGHPTTARQSTCTRDKRVRVPSSWRFFLQYNHRQQINWRDEPTVSFLSWGSWSILEKRVKRFIFSLSFFLILW